jgi:heptosyltransferase-3
MNISKEINVLRRLLMRRLTSKTGKSYVDRVASSKLEIKRILICRPNQRLGNLLLITPLLEDVIATFPDCKIDLFVKGFLAPTLFKNYKNVNLIFELPKKPFEHLIKYFQVWLSIKKQKYDIVINVDENSSSGRLATQFSNSKNKFFGEASKTIQLKYEDDEHFAKFPVYNFRSYLTQLGIKENNTPIASLNLKLSPFEIAEGKKNISSLFANENKTVCLFTYATGDKCYSTKWWESFYERLKTEYPNYNFIEVLPVENVSQIGFKAPTFYSKDVREIGSVIANTELFIGADSGIMHLSSSVNTPTLGLFSVSDLKKYRPYNNQSIGINTDNSNIDEIIKVLNSILN